MNTKEITAGIEQLPPHAMVAVAARFARRFEPCLDRLTPESRDEAIRWIETAERYARGEDIGSSGSILRDAEPGKEKFVPGCPGSARGAAGWAYASAAQAARAAVWAVAAVRNGVVATTQESHDNAVRSAREALGFLFMRSDKNGSNTEREVAAAVEEFAAAVESDLSRLTASGSTDVERPIDPSPDGPLGVLWPSGVPTWLMVVSGRDG